MVKKTALQNAIAPGPFDPLPDRIQIFQIDQANMVLDLHSLRRAIDAGAEEIEMVSAESVFSKSLSRTLGRCARKLRLAANDLNRLILLVERAHAPNAPPPSASKPKPRKRRLATN
jgi:hypothetical protein